MEKKANYSYFITAVKSLTYIAPFCLTNTPISSQILCNNDMNVGWQNKMAEIERSVGSIIREKGTELGTNHNRVFMHRTRNESQSSIHVR